MISVFTHLNPVFKLAVLMPFLALLPASAENALSSVENSQVVAEVNATKLTKQQLRSALALKYGDQLHQFAESDRHLLLKRLLDRLVERELVLQAARAAGHLPSKEEVSTFISELESDLAAGTTLDGLLQARQMSEEQFRKGVEEDLAIRAYLTDSVYDSVSVSDADVEEHYRSHQEDLRVPEEVRARHILIRLSEDASQIEIDSARQKIERLRSLAVASGGDFDQLAKEHSEGPSAAKGGDLGFFTRSQLEPGFSEVAFALQEGEVSQPVRTRFGYHIIQLEARRGGDLPAFEDIQEELRKQLVEERQRKLLKQHVQELRTKNKVIIYYN